jgi:hypothetical protein
VLKRQVGDTMREGEEIVVVPFNIRKRAYEGLISIDTYLECSPFGLLTMGT